jgi:hypothetical protein
MSSWKQVSKTIANMQSVVVTSTLLMVAFLQWAPAAVTTQDKPVPEPASPGSIVKELASQVENVLPLVQKGWTKKWMSTLDQLPPVEPRTIVYKEKERMLDESMFYSGRYGSPLSYARAIDLAVSSGFEGEAGSRVFDFGYGSIGHLRMMALADLHVTGVDVEPLLQLMYRDATGPLGRGSVQLLDGRFPKEKELVEKAGNGYSMVISKNVLKRGYIHPSREVSDPRWVIDLGVSDAEFLNQIAKMLNPSGLFMIYNFCPAKAPADKTYIPWSEGESPFTREDFEKAGFNVLEFDVVDDGEARKFAKALGWDQSMDLETELFAWYTIVQKQK